MRQIADTFDSPTQAVTALERAHGDALRPGPAPVTDTERQTATAIARPPGTGQPDQPTHAEPPVPHIQTVPVYAADPGDHDAVLDEFVAEQRDGEKWRTFSDDTTHVIHESQTLRIQLLHEADPREEAWTIAAYETPVSDRMWHLTLTARTPAPLLKTLLISLAHRE
ncbi:DUF317 domain-containing protein [Streptomyces sp. DT2A-34]|uniref:DUF317 domain-containing protein n=1 Tax=Streptomyces sp. DT2A-34 TaxID=3051182 RepID=UPI00265B7433|nr:DUF317 domain-containing protein [Streptomyces sp. DT2A-34]MDO0916742.1 DUF317 domain-containing protein [Streptomyces sp. DT2A-34]